MYTYICTMCTYHTVGTDTTYVEYHNVHRYILTYHLTYSRHSHLKIEFPSFLRFYPPLLALLGPGWPFLASNSPGWLRIGLDLPQKAPRTGG